MFFKGEGVYNAFCNGAEYRCFLTIFVSVLLSWFKWLRYLRTFI
jgi:hypothetical protein